MYKCSMKIVKLLFLTMFAVTDQKMASRKFQGLIISVLCGILMLRDEVFAQSGCTDLKPTPVRVQQEEAFKIDDERVIMCEKGACEALELSSIQKAYPDSFSKQTDAEERTGLQYNDYVLKVPSVCTQLSASVCKLWNDKDKCCRTWRYVTFTTGPLTNISGRSCYIIQMPFLGLYQFISVGICGPRNWCDKCVQQYTVQSLLAWCPGTSGIRVHHFRIPTYCSCQNCQ